MVVSLWNYEPLLSLPSLAGLSQGHQTVCVLTLFSPSFFSFKLDNRSVFCFFFKPKDFNVFTCTSPPLLHIWSSTRTYGSRISLPYYTWITPWLRLLPLNSPWLGSDFEQWSLPGFPKAALMFPECVSAGASTALLSFIMDWTQLVICGQNMFLGESEWSNTPERWAKLQLLPALVLLGFWELKAGPSMMCCETPSVPQARPDSAAVHQKLWTLSDVA